MQCDAFTGEVNFFSLVRQANPAPVNSGTMPPTFATMVIPEGSDLLDIVNRSRRHHYYVATKKQQQVASAPRRRASGNTHCRPVPSHRRFNMHNTTTYVSKRGRTWRTASSLWPWLAFAA